MSHAGGENGMGPPPQPSQPTPYDDDIYADDDDSDDMMTEDGNSILMHHHHHHQHNSNLARHTQFLDLTNGEGGERMTSTSPSSGPASMPANASASASSSSVGANMAANGAGGGKSAVLGTGKKFDFSLNPHTPGKVVESGREHTGRWTKEEHEAFLSALQMYGKEWKKVAAKVKTRTVVQTRTHAQKYFQKLHKAIEGGGGKDGVDMSVVMEAGTGGGGGPGGGGGGGGPGTRKGSGQKKKRGAERGAAANTRSGAAAMIGRSNSPSSMPGPAPLLSPLGSATRKNSLATAAQLVSNLSSIPTGSMRKPQDPPSHAFTAPAKHQLLPPSPEESSFSAPHGFSTGSSASAYSNNISLGKASYISSDGAFRGATVIPPRNTATFSMKIVAPDHDAASKRGKFPEPSPAACGKRKLAEIDVARMLAGVASGAAMGTEDTMIDRTETPPPPPQSMPQPYPSTTTGASIVSDMGGQVIPAPKPSGSMSLQIVNPESLGVTYSKKRRSTDGQSSPVTPWDGQLEALVGESKSKPPAAPSAPKLPPLLMANPTYAQPGGYPHPVCGPGTGYRRTRLHRAVCELDLHNVQSQLALNPDSLKKPDDSGYYPIHSVCALALMPEHNLSLITTILKTLLSTSAMSDVTVTDPGGNTALHWAARSGHRTAVEMLLRLCAIDVTNDSGETPLHWAMRAGRRGTSVVNVLLDSGARTSISGNDFRRPVDVAAEGFLDEEESVVSLNKLVKQRKRLTKEQRRILKDAVDEKRQVRANLLQQSVQSRTLVLHHPECLEHIPKAATDWEAPARITTILERLFPTSSTMEDRVFDHQVSISQEFDRARLDLLSRVHSTEYLSFVNNLSKELEKASTSEGSGTFDEAGGTSDRLTPPVVPFTPMVQRSMVKFSESRVKLGQHSDTAFSAGSLKAARRAAGAVQHAVDCVLVGRNRNAFCIVRPPGHHAGVNGLLDGGESCGFCIFNNVAAGALHAISDERQLCERCAIVDIDVHHGNGTEEIVRKCHDPSKLFFFSIHVYDNEWKGKRESKSFQYKFYPGTGDEDDVAFNIVNVPIPPMWKDQGANNKAPATRRKTRQRSQEERDSIIDDDAISEGGTPKASDNDSEGRPSNSNLPSDSSAPSTPRPQPPQGGRHAYRQAILNRLLPALRAFNPDLILVSTGFDASKGDVGNAKHEHGGRQRMGIDLEPEDYAWTTRKIMEIADICCQGRVVSVLEGGYGRTTDEQQQLDRSGLGECAMRHLQAMIDPYDSEQRFGMSVEM